MIDQAKSDAYIELIIDPSKMRLDLRMVPQKNQGRPLDEEYITSLLDKEGIVYGIDWEKIRDGMLKCNLEHRVVTLEKTAAGMAPLPYSPSHIELIPQYSKGFNQGTTENEKGQIDYRRISPFLIVNKNALIGRQIAPEEGSPGKNIFGENLEPERRDISVLEAGANIKIEGDAVKAAKSGLLVKDENTIRIEEKLEINEDIDFHTGNITFPGPVSVKGLVHDNFYIHTGGNLSFEQTVDASEIFCKAELTTKGGIIGKHREGIVRAIGKINTKFIENCRVESKSSIYLQNSSLNSQLYSLDRIVLGKQGKIIGGTVIARNGISADSIGNESKVQTFVECGTNFISKRKLALAKERLASLERKITHINQKLEADENKALFEQKAELLEKKRKIAVFMENELIHLDFNEESEILVYGMIFPGVSVQICRASMMLTEPHSKVRFRLDKESGHILIEALSAEGRIPEAETED